MLTLCCFSLPQAIESVKRIQRAVISMLIACGFLMTAIVWRFFIDTCHKEDQLAENTSYLWFATFVHACEALVAVALLYALFKPTSNVQKNQSKSRGIESTNQSTNQYVSAQNDNPENA